MNRDQMAATCLALKARSLEDYEKAHVAMRKAFASLAKVYPCTCDACLSEARKG
jgi:hypothetical protein